MTIANTATDRTTARRPRWPLFLGLAVTIVVLDQLAKSWIVANIDVGRPVEVFGDTIRLTLSHNSGGLFGLFGGQAPIFAALSIAVIGLIVWYESRVGSGLLATLALGLLVGGAIGNLIARPLLRRRRRPRRPAGRSTA